MALESLKHKIVNKSAKLGVIGLGYVGLPLACEFAQNGISVLGFDVSEAKVKRINSGESYILDVEKTLLKSVVEEGLLSATTDFKRLQDVDIISICVPTPLSKTKDPDMSFIAKAVESIKANLKKGQLIILESTTYPGTTEEVILPELEATGMTVGKDFFLAFSPERVDPGNEKYHTKNTPKVLGGVTQACTELGKLTYQQALDTIVTVSSPRAAEMVKLLENTFRGVNIAMANEMVLMCDKLDVNVWEVIDAAATKPFGFMPFYPGPGLGGHCIPIDPLYLSWKLKTLNYDARFIALAGEINNHMPRYVVEKTMLALNSVKKSINGAKILILGVAYKANINDLRESPALDIIEELEALGAEIAVHDPYIPEAKWDDKAYKSIELTPKRLKEFDCVVLVTNHDKTDIHEVVEHANLIVDTRNATKGIKSDKVVLI